MALELYIKDIITVYILLGFAFSSQNDAFDAFLRWCTWLWFIHHHFILFHSTNYNPASTYLFLLLPWGFGLMPLYYFPNGATGTFSFMPRAARGRTGSEETKRCVRECVTVGIYKTPPNCLAEWFCFPKWTPAVYERDRSLTSLVPSGAVIFVDWIGVGITPLQPRSPSLWLPGSQASLHIFVDGMFPLCKTPGHAFPPFC